MIYTPERREAARQRAFSCPPTYLPSEEEIAAQCEQIQATWTRQQRRYRYMMARTTHSIHETDVGGWTPQEWRTVDFCVG